MIPDSGCSASTIFFKANVHEMTDIQNEQNDNYRRDSWQRDVPDAPEPRCSVHLGRLVESAGSPAQRRNIDNGLPPHVLPDVRADKDGLEPAGFLKKTDRRTADGLD